MQTPPPACGPVCARPELPDLYTSLCNAAAETVRVVQGIEDAPAMLGAPTPSAGWDLRTVVNHVIL
ncbi:MULTISPECIES: hypothetical protein [Kitasatospora]|uniref:Mycothiol-dependent maleylpyruvate isomerase metal-binding domain-containing protein n=1 Tax=Kitasatospora cystarginea TaxID=58350 RepID=A0ABP5RNF7_9ACTN